MHPAHHHVEASKKRQRDRVEGRARGGKLDRPGRAFGGAAEDKETQSTADEYPGPKNIVERKDGGKLTTKERRAIPGKDFAGPDRSYPIENASHGRNALARVSQHGSPALKSEVRRKVHEKYPTIKEG
jgi:hypothetical protein